MIFGDPHIFAVEVYHEPSATDFRGFGRMCLHVGTDAIGDILDHHCSLFDAIQRIHDAANELDSRRHKEFCGKNATEIFTLLDHAIFLGPDSLEEFVRFDFLTNSGEMFDGTKTFLYTSHDTDDVHLLYQRDQEPPQSAMLHRMAFVNPAFALYEWFQREIVCPARLFPVNPFAEK